MAGSFGFCGPGKIPQTSRQIALPKIKKNHRRASPDPPTLAFLEKKARETPKKARVFLFAEILNSLEKKGKTHQNSKENRENEKSKDIEKSKDWRVRVCRSSGRTTHPEPQNSQSDYFYCLTLSGRLFFVPFSLMKLAWWSWASGYQTNSSLCFVGKPLPD